MNQELIERYFAQEIADANPAGFSAPVQEVQPLPLAVPQGSANPSFPWKLLLSGVLTFSFAFFLPIGAAMALSYTAEMQGDELVSPVAALPQEYIQAKPVSASPAPSTELEYELSLANGFLNKAISLSNASTEQTAEEKDKIIYLLNQALESANRAVGLAPADPRPYSARGRVYQAVSTIKPEMLSLAQADFAKAQELGAAQPMQPPATVNPLETLPVEQAQAPTTAKAVIAAPEESNSTTLDSAAGQNAKRGMVQFGAGEKEVAVTYSSIKEDTQLYVTAENNPENIVFYVKNKTAGEGFTLAATQAPASPVTVQWWEVETYE